MSDKCVNLADMRTVRAAMAVSQRRLADLLGVSIRAVQSYEQGWRPVPPAMQRLAGMMLTMVRRQGRPAGDPCWKTRRCAPDVRDQCVAYQTRAADFCWALTGTRCQGKESRRWDTKIRQCMKCPVMARWLYC